MNLRLLTVCLAFGPLLTAMGNLKVASFSTIDTEIVQNIGGNHVEVTGVIKPGIDPHEYEPTPADLAQVHDAKLVLTSGKELESYQSKLQEATTADILKVGDHLPSLKMKSGEDSNKPGQNGMIQDPHWWHSVANVKQATKVVRDELIKLDPSDKAEFEQNATTYLAQLTELDGWVKRKVAELPRDKRKLVTSHDAFQYFAHEYGFTIEAIEGISPEVEASNRHVSELIDQIKNQGVKAIFLETGLNPKVTEEITKETGAKSGGSLYPDGLGTGDAATYSGMMKHNVTTIVDALK